MHQLEWYTKGADKMISTDINIARDFSNAPGGRKKSEGSHSAEEFRDNHLIPALKSADQVRVNLDGTFGYASSFLEEAFGGAARILGKELVKSKLVVFSDETPRYVTKVNSYINDVSNDKPKPKPA